MNRELRACGRHGHLTYAPDEADLRRRIRADSAIGELWRCLRCGDFVPGPPRSSGPADRAPVPPRGKALRQILILRVLGVERVIRGVLLLAGSYAVLRFRSSQASLREVFLHDLPAARPLADRLGFDIDRSSLVTALNRALTAKTSTLAVVAALLAAYGALEMVEGVGLWLARRWAEYLTVVATAAFLPLEVHELLKSLTVTRVLTFLLNVAIVVYLLLAKRLFGLRGGQPAYQRELTSESLLEVEAAAGEGHSPAELVPGAEVGMGGRPAG